MPSDGVRSAVAVVDGLNHRGGLKDWGSEVKLAVLANRGPLAGDRIEGREDGEGGVYGPSLGAVPSTAPRVAWV